MLERSLVPVREASSSRKTNQPQTEKKSGGGLGNEGVGHGRVRGEHVTREGREAQIRTRDSEGQARDDREGSRADEVGQVGARDVVESALETDYSFRSTEAIASDTNLTEARVATLCARDPRIRRSQKEKQSWTLA